MTVLLREVLIFVVLWMYYGTFILAAHGDMDIYEYYEVVMTS